MMADLLGRLAPIDILVNNAVVRHFAPVEAFAPEHWEEALAVNLSAPFHLIRLALPAMKKRGWGRIINMASIYSTRAVADRIDYVTTKTAILGMTRAVAIETATSGITCNALCPGTLPTPAIDAENCIDRGRRRPHYRGERRATIWRRASRPAGLSPWKASARWLSFSAARPHRTSRARALPIDGGWSIA